LLGSWPLPLVLLISRFDGSRFWFLALSGMLAGSALLIVTNLCIEFAEHQTFDIVKGWNSACSERLDGSGSL